MERTVTPVVLEPAAREFADVTSRPPFVHEMTPDEPRRVLDDLQAGPVEKPPVAEEWVTVVAGAGDVRVRIVRPPEAPDSGDRARRGPTGGWRVGLAWPRGPVGPLR